MRMPEPCTTDSSTIHARRQPGNAFLASLPSPASCCCWPWTAHTDGIQHHNVWFPQDYDAGSTGCSHRPRALTGPGDLRVRAGRPVDTPRRHRSWFTCSSTRRRARPEGLDWDTHREACADHPLDVLAARGVDLRARLRWRGSTPRRPGRTTVSPGGSIYGMSSNGRLSTVLRPSNRTAVPRPVPGGRVRTGGGLPLVGMGAEIVAGRSAGRNLQATRIVLLHRAHALCRRVNTLSGGEWW